MAHILIQQRSIKSAPDRDSSQSLERVALNATFKITLRLIEHMRADLQRLHPFAYERVGFVACRFALAAKGNQLILAHEYYPVADEDYIDDPRYGALIGSEAFRKAMQLAYSQNVGIFHFHLHDHKGTPMPSMTDLRETSAFIPDFFHVQPALPHGALILSRNSIAGRVWQPNHSEPSPITTFILVGALLSKVQI
jgi:hypothetical protein